MFYLIGTTDTQNKRTMFSFDGDCFIWAGDFTGANLFWHRVYFGLYIPVDEFEPEPIVNAVCIRDNDGVDDDLQGTLSGSGSSGGGIVSPDGSQVLSVRVVSHNTVNLGFGTGGRGEDNIGTEQGWPLSRIHLRVEEEAGGQDLGGGVTRKVAGSIPQRLFSSLRGASNGTEIPSTPPYTHVTLGPGGSTTLQQVVFYGASETLGATSSQGGVTF